MKKIYELLFLFFITSCSSDKVNMGDPYDETIFILKNNSGVQVAIVAGSSSFVDSLVILPGDEHRWLPLLGSAWPHPNNTKTKVYYDVDKLIVYGVNYMPERNPGCMSNYVMLPPTEGASWSNIFTFTPEDYQNALKHNGK